jgi:hypothetical protein
MLGVNIFAHNTSLVPSSMLGVIILVCNCMQVDLLDVQPQPVGFSSATSTRPSSTGRSLLATSMRPSSIGWFLVGYVYASKLNLVFVRRLRLRDRFTGWFFVGYVFASKLSSLIFRRLPPTCPSASVWLLFSGYHLRVQAQQFGAVQRLPSTFPSAEGWVLFGYRLRVQAQQVGCCSAATACVSKRSRLGDIQRLPSMCPRAADSVLFGY